MKKRNSFKRIILPVSLLVLLGACKKDDVLESQELLVYMQGDYGTANNQITAALTNTPIDIWGNRTYKLPIQATREVTTDVTLNVQPDAKYVGTFNTDNKLKAKMMPENSYKLNSGTHTIKAGSAIVNTLEVQIIAPNLFTDTTGYVLPVTIASVVSDDKGVQISTNKSTAYVYVPYKYTNIDTVQTPLAVGTVMGRTGWAVTVSNTTSGALGPAMLDGSNTTSWRSSNAVAEKWVVLNMGSSKLVKGFRLVPNYVTTTENATAIIVSSSTDNVTWKVLGTWKGTGPAAGSSATAPDLKNINFLVPIQAQYFRFEITAQVSGNRVGIAELNGIE
jgi:hypothetical protein